jgi:hypothetical protein
MAAHSWYEDNRVTLTRLFPDSSWQLVRQGIHEEHIAAILSRQMASFSESILQDLTTIMTHSQAETGRMRIERVKQESTHLHETFEERTSSLCLSTDTFRNKRTTLEKRLDLVEATVMKALPSNWTGQKGKEDRVRVEREGVGDGVQSSLDQVKKRMDDVKEVQSERTERITGNIMTRLNCSDDTVRSAKRGTNQSKSAEPSENTAALGNWAYGPPLPNPASCLNQTITDNSASKALADLVAQATRKIPLRHKSDTTQVESALAAFLAPHYNKKRTGETSVVIPDSQEPIPPATFRSEHQHNCRIVHLLGGVEQTTRDLKNNLAKLGFNLRYIFIGSRIGRDLIEVLVRVNYYPRFRALCDLYSHFLTIVDRFDPVLGPPKLNNCIEESSISWQRCRNRFQKSIRSTNRFIKDFYSSFLNELEEQQDALVDQTDQKPSPKDDDATIDDLYFRKGLCPGQTVL